MKNMKCPHCDNKLDETDRLDYSAGASGLFFCQVCGEYVIPTTN